MSRKLEYMTARGLLQALNNAHRRIEDARFNCRREAHGTDGWKRADARLDAAQDRWREVDWEVRRRLVILEKLCRSNNFVAAFAKRGGA